MAFVAGRALHAAPYRVEHCTSHASLCSMMRCCTLCRQYCLQGSRARKRCLVAGDECVLCSAVADKGSARVCQPHEALTANHSLAPVWCFLAQCTMHLQSRGSFQYNLHRMLHDDAQYYRHCCVCLANAMVWLYLAGLVVPPYCQWLRNIIQSGLWITSIRASLCLCQRALRLPLQQRVHACAAALRLNRGRASTLQYLCFAWAAAGLPWVAVGNRHKHSLPALDASLGYTSFYVFVMADGSFETAATSHAHCNHIQAGLMQHCCTRALSMCGAADASSAAAGFIVQYSQLPTIQSHACAL